MYKIVIGFFLLAASLLYAAESLNHKITTDIQKKQQCAETAFKHSEDALLIFQEVVANQPNVSRSELECEQKEWAAKRNQTCQKQDSSVVQITVCKQRMNENRLNAWQKKYRPEGDVLLLKAAELLQSRTITIAAFKELFKHGATPRLVMHSYAPVREVYYENNLALLRLLIDAGADVNTSGEGGFTPLMYAVLDKKTDAMHFLLEKGADIHAVNANGATVLMMAVMSDDKENVAFLLSKGVEVNAACNDGRTALMVASYWGDERLVKLLIDAGADVNASGGSGKLTPAMLASYAGQKQILETLLKHGAKAPTKKELDSFDAWDTLDLYFDDCFFIGP